MDNAQKALALSLKITKKKELFQVKQQFQGLTKLLPLVCGRSDVNQLFRGEIQQLLHALLRFFMHVSVSYQWSLLVNTLADWVSVFVCAAVFSI